MFYFVVIWFAGAMQPAVETGPFVSERECIEYMGEWVDRLPANVEALSYCDYRPPVILLARAHR